MQITDTTVRKRSIDTAKVMAEAAWLRSIPAVLKPYCIRLLAEEADDEGYSYVMEFEPSPTLAALYVSDGMNRTTWLRILESCGDLLRKASDCGLVDAGDALHRLAVQKTLRRIEDFARGSGFDIDAPNRLNGAPAPSLRACAAHAEDVIAALEPRPAVMHGDFCFSNILYDVQANRIRLIDPRGAIEGVPTIFGDTRYDVAKLSHSIVGRYDMLVAGRFAGGGRSDHDFLLEFPVDPDKEWLEGVAQEMAFGGVRLGSEGTLAVTMTLFLSMLPLHADRPDRQRAFIANALRLQRRLEAGN